jgi:hypothetical protein
VATSQWDRASDKKEANERHEQLKEDVAFFKDILKKGGIGNIKKYPGPDTHTSIIDAVLHQYS